MKGGDTIIVALPNASVDSQLWSVISDPEIDQDNIVIVNMTSWRSDKDQACVLDVGDHCYVKHRTCINYEDAKIQSAANLEALLSSGKIAPHVTCSEELLVRIRNSVNESRMKMSVVDILVSQGVVEEI